MNTEMSIAEYIERNGNDILFPSVLVLSFIIYIGYQASKMVDWSKGSGIITIIEFLEAAFLIGAIGWIILMIILFIYTPIQIGCGYVLFWIVVLIVNTWLRNYQEG